jgi:hypothetical protein
MRVRGGAIGAWCGVRKTFHELSVVTRTSVKK